MAAILAGSGARGPARTVAAVRGRVNARGERHDDGDGPDVVPLPHERRQVRAPDAGLRVHVHASFLPQGPHV
jgi:hypothetical protein